MIKKVIHSYHTLNECVEFLLVACAVGLLIVAGRGRVKGGRRFF